MTEEQRDDHSRANELFTDKQEGTLSAQDKTFLDSHLAACVMCQGEWEKYQKVVSALSGLKQKEPTVEAGPPDLLPGTADKINRRTHGLFFRKSRFGVSYELITILILFLFGAVYLVLHLMRSAEPSKITPLPTPGTQKQGALNPRQASAGEDERPRGVVVQEYAFALNAPADEEVQRHLARIVLTASGKLGEWQETPEGLSAEFSVPYNRFVSFYKDLGANYTWTETKTTQRIPEMNPPVKGTLILQR